MASKLIVNNIESLDTGRVIEVDSLADRQDLANDASGSGASLVSMEGGPTVEDAVLDRVIRVTSIAEMEAYSAPVGYVFSLNAGGRSGDFDVIAGDFSTELAADTLNGIYVGQADDPTATSKVSRRRSEENVNVKWFGALGDGSDQTSFFNAAAAYAESESVDNGGNKGPVIEVFDGVFSISSQITNKANWHLHPNAIINGLPKVEPTSEDDTTYLTGKVFKYTGIDQSRVLRIGDPSFKTQVVTKKGHVGEVTAISANGSTGLAGLSYTVTDGSAQGCIGVEGIVIADEGDDSNTVYGLYSEAYRSPATAKNAFGMEITSFNFGNTLQLNPYQAVGSGDGITANLNLTVGDTSADGTIWGGDANDITCAVYVLGKGGAAFDKGIIFTNGSITSDIALALSETHRLSWMNAGSREVAYLGKEEQRLEAAGPVVTKHVRWPEDASGSGGYATQGLVSDQQFISRAAGEVDYKLASIRVFQQEDFSSGEVGSRFDLVANNQNGTSQRYQFLPIHFSADDNTASCGSPGRRWKEIFAVSGTIDTSDERDKIEITSIDERELLVAQACKSLLKKFKFKDAVAKKGKNARWHFGVIAQDVVEAFESQNLDAMKYGCVCYDEWDEQEEQTDEEGNVTSPYVAAGNRYGIRYSELLAFIISAI